MKYIRTKDGRIVNISEYKKKDLYYQDTHSPNYIAFSKIIKEADTIEELCDEFVDIDNYDYYKIAHENGITYALSKTKRFIGHCDIRLKYIGQIMGAIWTEKGLIYVAKMNERGGLELL